MKKHTGPNRPFDRIVGPEEEPTQVTRGAISRPRITVVLVAAVLGAVIAAAALVVATRRAPRRVQREDPLVLYQVARELHDNGDDTSALETIARARRLATHARSRRQLDALQREIELSPHLRKAREHIESGGFDSARDELSHVLSRDPQNEKAFLLMQLLQQRTSARAETPRPAGGVGSVSDVAPRLAPPPAPPLAAPSSSDGAARARRDRARARRGRQSREPRGSEPAVAQAPAIEPGTVDVQSNAPGRVFVDGQLTHQDAPVVLTLEPGLHTIELVPASDPSTRLQKRVMVQGGRLATIRFQVAPPRPPEPQPSAASQVDEESPPASPPASPARPPARRERAPSASAPPTVSEQQPAMGSVYVLADAPGYVFVDGVNTGKVTPVRLKLPPGQHEIVIVVQRTNERLRHEIDVKPGKLLKLRFRLGSQ